MSSNDSLWTQASIALEIRKCSPPTACVIVSQIDLVNHLRTFAVHHLQSGRRGAYRVKLELREPYPEVVSATP